MTTERPALVSIVVPTFNEGQGIREFHRRLSAMLEGQTFDAEVIYVNDGSTDDTFRVLEDLANEDGRIALIDLSRNFGKEIAVTAGLDHAQGEATVLIDADLQDPPELIPALVRKWREGYDVVYAKRTAREGETFLKKATAYLFYRAMRSVSRVEIPTDAGDFRLLSRQAVDALKQLREQHRFMKGLFSWIGYPQAAVPYLRHARHAGATKWNYWRLWNFALEGFTSFTTGPLKMATYLGLVVALLAFAFGAFILYKTLVYGDPVPGYPSLMVVMLFLGGTQLMALGVIGEYLGRMFDESKGRPLYFAKQVRFAGRHGRKSAMKAMALPRETA